MGKPGVRLSSGNARPLRRIRLAGERPAAPQRGSARGGNGTRRGSDHAGAARLVFGVALDRVGSPLKGRQARTTFAAAVERLEREMIESALEKSAGNISKRPARWDSRDAVCT